MTSKNAVQEKPAAGAVAGHETNDVARSSEMRTLRFTPRTDIFETKEAFLLHLDLPGVDRKDLDVRFEENVLAVHARAHAPSAGHRRPLHHAWDVKEFYRSFQLPEGVDVGAIEATLNDGVLTLRLPKAKELQPRKIPIGVQGD